VEPMRLTKDLELQQQLANEAREVEIDLALTPRLSEIGCPNRVGSAALGVMVCRDLDVTTTCRRLDEATRGLIARLGASVSLHPRVREVCMRDDTGSWRQDPTYPDGLYLGIQYRSRHGDDWTIDLWFVDQPELQPDLQHLNVFAPALTDQRRAAILAIKKARTCGVGHSSQASSYDVYRAVLLHGVETPEQFDAWRAGNPREANSSNPG